MSRIDNATHILVRMARRPAIRSWTERLAN